MPHRVLVVDDEESIRALIDDFLSGQGFQVIGAGDGDEGIEAFKKMRPHLAIIDFLLPRKNGFAVADAIRKDPDLGHTPIIMMSGVFKNPKTAVEAREKYQVVDFLSKPLDMDSLVNLIHESLEGVDPGPDIEPEPEPEPEPPPPREEIVAPSLEAKPIPGQEDASGHRPPPRGLSYFGSKPSGVEVPRAPGVEPKVEIKPQQVTQPDAPEKVAPEQREASRIEDGIYIGRPFPVLTEDGSIAELPVAQLLATIRYDKQTGMLDMTDRGTHRRIYIVTGNPTFMQSNAEGENVGALLLRRGRITEPDFERCLRYMKDQGRTLQQSLLEMRLVSDHDLATAYKLLAGQLLPLALGMGSGTFKWRETDAFIGRVPEGKFEPVAVLFDGIKRHVHPPQILKFFKGREDVPLVRTKEFDKLMPFFRRAFSASNISSQIDTSNTYRMITRRMANEAATVHPQLYALVTSGMAVLPHQTEADAMAVAVNVAAAEIVEMSNSEDDEIDLGLDDDDANVSVGSQGARSRIAKYYDEIMSKNFFEVFGAKPESDLEEIKSSYFDLAKKWHSDAFSEYDLGPAKPNLDDIFARITEAYDTITDKVKREEYVIYLDRKAKGLPTDVNEVFRSEQLFDQAIAMMRRRDFANAKQVLDEAVQLNPDPLFIATLGWAIFNLDQQSQEATTQAVQLIRKATQEQENMPVAYQYLGSICFARGDLSQAKKWWRRCLEWEPNNIEAARGIRMADQRAEKSGDSGLISKLMKKK